MRRLLCKFGWHEMGPETRALDATGFWVFYRRACLRCGHRISTGYAKIGSRGRIGPRYKT